jgi:hypothetical protein
MLLQPTKILSPSTQEESHLVNVGLGGHGGGFTDSNSPEEVERAIEKQVG